MRSTMVVPLLGQPWCHRIQGLEGASCTVAHSFYSFFMVQCSTLGIGRWILSWLCVVLGCGLHELWLHVGSFIDAFDD
jgi:hypothetical protein